MDSTNTIDLINLRDKLLRVAETFSPGNPYHRFFQGLAECVEDIRQDVDKGYAPDARHLDSVLSVIDIAVTKK